MSVYAPLEHRLANADQSALTLSFEQIETLLGRKLPPSAYDDRIKRQWWANTDTHAQAKAWLKTGRKARLDAVRNQVTFVREPSGDVGSITLRNLTPAAMQLIRATARGRDISASEAAVVLLNDAARARRQAILDEMDGIRGRSVLSRATSAVLIREDRDAR